MNYTDANRGQIQSPGRIKQVVAFEGMRYGSITPTDVDGFFEKDDETYVFYEYKYAGAPVPHGQGLALKRLVDMITSTGRKAILIVCKHNVEDVNVDVVAKDVLVDRYYFNGTWYYPKRECPPAYITAKQLTDRFMKAHANAG